MERELRTWDVDSPLTDRPSKVNLVSDLFLFWGVTSPKLVILKVCL